jgi:hypothetical protein
MPDRQNPFDVMRHPGQIILWPGGYAMTLAIHLSGNSMRCCDGHETPEDAKNHGLVRLIELASRVADEHIAAWAAREAA